MMYVTDTMALVLYLEERRSGANATSIFKEAEKGNVTIYIPSITIAEIGYLSERKRITCSLSHVNLLLTSNKNICECPLSFDIVEKAFDIKDIPELHDRLIAGTAAALSLPLITNDPLIIASQSCSIVW